MIENLCTVVRVGGEFVVVQGFSIRSRFETSEAASVLAGLINALILGWAAAPGEIGGGS